MEFLKKLFRAKTPPPSLAQISYVMAYRILPQYAFDSRHDLGMWAITQACGPFFYLMTMGLAFGKRPEECDVEVGPRFQWHTGQLEDGRTYFLMEYPLTPEHTEVLSEEEFLRVAKTREKCALPPFFSAMVGRVEGEEFRDVRYFVLGKSPEPGRTTLREVTSEANMNRGMGPEPRLEKFLEAIR